MKLQNAAERLGTVHTYYRMDKVTLIHMVSKFKF